MTLDCWITEVTYQARMEKNSTFSIYIKEIMMALTLHIVLINLKMNIIIILKI